MGRGRRGEWKGMVQLTSRVARSCHGFARRFAGQPVRDVCGFEGYRISLPRPHGLPAQSSGRTRGTRTCVTAKTNTWYRTYCFHDGGAIRWMGRGVGAGLPMNGAGNTGRMPVVWMKNMGW